MTFSDLSAADKPYEDVKREIPVQDDTKNGRYDAMMRDFYGYVALGKENPFSYEHEYLVQEVLSEIVGGIRFPGRNID